MTELEKAIAEYERAMREDVIPQIERDLKAQARAAHFARLGIPDPLARIEAGTGETTQLARSEGREPDKLQRTNP